MKKVKISVVKKMYNEDLIKLYSSFDQDHSACPKFSEGQTFICGKDMPEGFCSWAWDDIYKLVFAALGGANFNEIVPNCSKENNSIIGCCTDGFRPVIFTIETIETIDT